MKEQALIMLLLGILAAILLLMTSTGCSTKRVMKDCEQVNDSHLWLCKHQYEVWR